MGFRLTPSNLTLDDIEGHPRSTSKFFIRNISKTPTDTRLDPRKHLCVRTHGHLIGTVRFDLG